MYYYESESSSGPDNIYFLGNCEVEQYSFGVILDCLESRTVIWRTRVTMGSPSSSLNMKRLKSFILVISRIWILGSI